MGDRVGSTHQCPCRLAIDRPAVCGVNINPRHTGFADPGVPQLNEVGAKAVRLVFKLRDDLLWDAARLEEAHNEAFGMYDGLVNSFREAGIGVLMVLNRESTAGDAANPDLFRDQAARIAAHYGSNVDFEIWNEQNLEATWLEPAAYAAVLTAAVEAIEPHGARVIIGGVGYEPAATTRDYLDAVREAAGSSIWNQVHGLGVHLYTSGPPPDLNALGGFRDRFGKPIWLTEWGDPNGDPSADPSTTSQVSTMESYFEFFRWGARASRLVEAAHYFAWNDAQKQVPGEFYGLFDANNNRKPSWQTFHDAAIGTA